MLSLMKLILRGFRVEPNRNSSRVRVRARVIQQRWYEFAVEYVFSDQYSVLVRTNQRIYVQTETASVNL